MQLIAKLVNAVGEALLAWTYCSDDKLHLQLFRHLYFIDIELDVLDFCAMLASISRMSVFFVSHFW